MHIVADLEPDRPATTARRLASAVAPATEGPLLRWLRDQFLALPHRPSATTQPACTLSSDENLAD